MSGKVTSEGTHEVRGRAVASLGALREELRLKVHLAGMDARDLWSEELLPQLDALEAQLQARMRPVGEARLQAHLGLMELRQRWEELEPRLGDLVGRVTAQGRSSLADLLRRAKETIHAATEPAEQE